MLVEKGRLVLGQRVSTWRQELIDVGLEEVAVDGEIGALAAGLTTLHGDPADRLIAATAMQLGFELITADQRLLEWDGPLRSCDARE